MSVVETSTGHVQSTRTRRPLRKSERLETRATPELKNLAQRAAEIEGRSLTDFVAASVQERAERLIREHNVITLSLRDSEHFAALVLNPSAPNERLRTAMRRHKDEVEDTEL